MNKRILKFRVWDNKSKKFRFENAYDTFYIDRGKAYEKLEFGGDKEIDGIIQQFTGLWDRDGENEIFEGDIVSCLFGNFTSDFKRISGCRYSYPLDELRQIIYDNKYAKWIGKAIGNKIEDEDLYECLTHTYKIGTIFENPSLLK